MSGQTPQSRPKLRRIAATTCEPTQGPVLDLERYVPALLTFVANKLSRSATATYQKHFGINVTTWRILSLLAIEPDIPARRICQVIGFDKGPVSRALAAMSSRALVAVRPDPGNRRSHIITLTPHGRAMHDRIIIVALERERRLLDCLDPGEQDLLIRLLVRLHGNLGALGPEAGQLDRSMS